MKIEEFDELLIACRNLTTAQQTSLGMEITMPVLYPNGNAVNVIVRKLHKGDYEVSDGGGGAGYLVSCGGEIDGETYDKNTANIAKQYGCVFGGMEISRQCTFDKIAVVAALVANASRAVGDLTMQAADKIDDNYF